MKKILSLLLAGLMMFALAGSVLADTCTSSLANANNNSLVYETILGKNWYYWYLLNNYGGCCPNPGSPTTDEDPIDPGFGVTPDTMIPTEYYVSCTEKLTNGKTCGKASQVFYSTSDGLTYKTYAYCSDHGMFEVKSNSLKPVLPTVATYTISTSAGVGGSISVTGATANYYSSYTVKVGDSVTVSITPDYGYVVDKVYLNGYYLGNTEGFTLDDIRCNYSVSATFRRVDTTRKYTITASATGNGDVYAVANGKSVGKFTSLIGTYADKVTLRFVPASDNYKVESVTINGVNMGSISTYEVGRMYTDMVVNVTFAWDCPYSDVTKEHLAAVEYVSEIDVMGSPNKYLDINKFEGTKSVTVRAMACYLAELADVSDGLNSVSDRLAWATKKGLIGEKEDLSVEATWTRAAEMLSVFVRNLEKDGNVVFTDLTNAKTAYDIVSKMGLVTEAAYKADGKITRYDMAEMCYGVSLLKTK